MVLASYLTGCTPSLPEGRLISFADLSGWADDDHAASFRMFHKFCSFQKNKKNSNRLENRKTVTVKQDDALYSICLKALTYPDVIDHHTARRFFERHFSPFEVHGDKQNRKSGFLTGYYEPEFEGALEYSSDFRYPLYSRPPDYVSISKEDTIPGVPKGRTAARYIKDKNNNNIFIPLPSRADIEKGALENLIQPLVYLKEAGQAFIIHVQGSAKIRLPDHSSLRVSFSGRNGYPYTSIGKVLVQKGEIPLSEMSLERLLQWLKDSPQKAQSIMNHNESFIFFRIAEELQDAEGPIGGAGLPLIPERSIAIDHTLWSYGLPIWLEGSLPALSKSKTQPLAKLTFALDTGAAIVGPARADFYWGSGTKAGTLAGTTSQKIRFVVFLPKNINNISPKEP